VQRGTTHICLGEGLGTQNGRDDASFIGVPKWSLKGSQGIREFESGGVFETIKAKPCTICGTFFCVFIHRELRHV